MEQATLWSEKATSFSYSEPDIMRWIMSLHNSGNPFELDPTFSKGRFWAGLSEPRLKFDLSPQRDDVKQADCRKLPFENESISSIMFDPPFVCGSVNKAKIGIIKGRFSYFKNVTELWEFYKESLIEFNRILKQDGIIAFKCQDTIDSGTNFMSHAKIMVEAQLLGLYVKDLFVLGRKNILWSPNMANQQHARKNHCYFLVLKKTKLGVGKKRAIVIC